MDFRFLNLSGVIFILERESKLFIKINPSLEDDIEDLANLTQQLRKELLELDVDNVDLRDGGQAPKGSKSANAIPDGLLVHIGAVVSIELFLQHIYPRIHSWLMRNERGKTDRTRSVTLDFEGDNLEVKGSDDQGRQRQIDEWINRQLNKIKR